MLFARADGQLIVNRVQCLLCAVYNKVDLTNDVGPGGPTELASLLNLFMLPYLGSGPADICAGAPWQQAGAARSVCFSHACGAPG